MLLICNEMAGTKNVFIFCRNVSFFFCMLIVDVIKANESDPSWNAPQIFMYVVF